MQSSTVMRAMGACPIVWSWRKLAEIEGREDGGAASLQRGVLETLGMNDRLEIEERCLEQGVDYNEVEVPGLRDLDARIGHAPRDHFGRVFAAPLQAREQLVPTRRQQEDQDRVREQLL